MTLSYGQRTEIWDEENGYKIISNVPIRIN